LQTGKKDTTLEHPDFVKSISVLPSGHIVTGCRDEQIRVFDPANEKCVAKITAHYDEVSCIHYQNGYFWSASLDCTLRKWQLSNVLQQFVNEEEEEEPVKNLMTEEEERELAELMGDD
jgi:WD40 repeat protein